MAIITANIVIVFLMRIRFRRPRHGVRPRPFPYFICRQPRTNGRRESRTRLARRHSPFPPFFSLRGVRLRAPPPFYPHRSLPVVASEFRSRSANNGQKAEYAFAYERRTRRRLACAVLGTFLLLAQVRRRAYRVHRAVYADEGRR